MMENKRIVAREYWFCGKARSIDSFVRVAVLSALLLLLVLLTHIIKLDYFAFKIVFVTYSSVSDSLRILSSGSDSPSIVRPGESRSRGSLDNAAGIRGYFRQ